VIKLQEKKEKVQKGELAKIKKEAAAAKANAAEAKQEIIAIRAKAKQDIDAAKKQAALNERNKNAIRFKRMQARNKKLQEEMKMLKKHTSPQEIGLADEGVLVKRLAREFPEDRIEHIGKGGDVLHYVVFDKEDVGCIVYECKHTDRISSDHVAQTSLAKKTAVSVHGILVTTGTRKGFSGLDQESGIFLVAQAGVLTLARICRESLVTMAKQRLDAAAKVAAAKRLMDYVTSPVCKTPLEEAISHTERAHKNLIREMKQHVNDWKDRHDLSNNSLRCIARSKEHQSRSRRRRTLKLDKPKIEPLALP
jgi:hypothetical protein